MSLVRDEGAVQELASASPIQRSRGLMPGKPAGQLPNSIFERDRVDTPAKTIAR
jgi:hypothetical protein